MTLGQKTSRGLEYWAWPAEVAWRGGLEHRVLRKDVQTAQEAREGAYRTWRHTWHSLQVSKDQPCLLRVLVGFSGPEGSKMYSL